MTQRGPNEDVEREHVPRTDDDEQTGVPPERTHQRGFGETAPAPREGVEGENPGNSDSTAP